MLRAQDPAATMPRAQYPAAPMPRAQGSTTPMPSAQDHAIAFLRTQDPATVMHRAQDTTTVMPRAQGSTTPMPRAQDHAIAFLRTQDPATVMHRAQDTTTAMPRAQDPATSVHRAQDPAIAIRTRDPTTTMPRVQNSATTMPRAQDSSTVVPRAQDSSTVVPRAQDPSNLSNYPPPFVFLGPRHPTIFYPKKLMFRAPGEMPLRFPPGVLLPNSTQQSQFYNSRQIRPSRHQQPLRPNPQQPTRPSNPQQPQKPSTLQQAPRLLNLQQASRFSNPQVSLYLPNPVRSRPQRPTSTPSHHQLTSFQNQIHQPMLRPFPVPHQRNLQPTHQGHQQATQYHLNMSNSPQNYLTQRPIDISDRNSRDSKPTGIKEEVSGMLNFANVDVNSPSPVPVIRRILPPPMLNNSPISDNGNEVVAANVNLQVEIDELELSESKDGEQFHLIKTGQELARMCFAVEVGCQTDLSFPLDKEIVVMPVETLSDLITTAPQDDKPKIEQVFVSDVVQSEAIVAIDEEATHTEIITAMDGDCDLKLGQAEDQSSFQESPPLRLNPSPGGNNIVRPGDSIAEQENAFQDQGIVHRERLIKENHDIATEIDLIKENVLENKIKDDYNQIEVLGNLSFPLNTTKSQKVQLPLENLNRDKSLEEILNIDTINTDSKLSKVKSENNDLKIIEDFKGEPKAASQNTDTCPGSLSPSPDVEEKASSFNPLSNFATLMSYTDPYIEAHLSGIRFNASTSAATQGVGQGTSQNDLNSEKDQLDIPISQISSQSIQKDMTDHANIEKPACVDNFPAKSIQIGEQSKNTAKSSYASAIICRNPKYKCANSENSSNSADLNHRLMNKNSLTECSNTSGGFLAEYEDPQPSTSTKLCQSGFTKSELKSPMDKIKTKENFGNPKPDVATRMSFDQFEELTEGNVSPKQRSRNVSQGISKTWNLSLLEALSATERRDCIPGITSLKKDNILNESIQMKLFKDSKNASSVKIEKESVINDKASPVNIEKEIFNQDTVKASPVNIEQEVFNQEKVSLVDIEKDTKIKDTVETSPIRIEMESVVKDTEKNCPIGNEKESMMKPNPDGSQKETMLKDTTETSPLNVKEGLIKDNTNTSPLCFQNESMIKDTVETNPLKARERLIKDTENASPLGFLNESKIKDTVKSSPLKVEGTLIKDTVETSPLKVEERLIKDTEDASSLGFQTESMIKDTVQSSPPKVEEKLIKNTENASPLGFQNESMIKDTVKSSPHKVEGLLIKDTVQTSPLEVEKESVVRETGKNSPIGNEKETMMRPNTDEMQKETMIKDTVQISPHKVEEGLIKDTENTSSLGFQNESMIKDTVKSNTLKLEGRLMKETENTSSLGFQNESMIKDTDKTSPVKIPKECVIINPVTNKQNLIKGIENKSAVGIKKESVMSATQKSNPIGNDKESVIKNTVMISSDGIGGESIINGNQNTSPIQIMTSPIVIQEESVSKVTVQTSQKEFPNHNIIKNTEENKCPIRVQRISVIKDTFKTTPVRIEKKSVIKTIIKTSSVRIQKEGVIEDTDNASTVKIQKEGVIEDTDNASTVRIQKEGVIEDTDNAITVRIQKEGVIEDTDNASTVRIQKKGVIENTDNASTAKIQKEATNKSTENQNERLIKSSGYKKIQEERSSRGRILKKRKFDDYDDCYTDSDDDEEGNSSILKCQNLCSSKFVENKVILTTRKSKGLEQHYQNDVKNIGNTMLQKSPMIISIIHPANDVSRNLRDLELEERVITDLEDYEPTKDDERFSVQSIPKIKSRNSCERGDRVLRSASKVNFQFIPAEHNKTKDIKEATGKRKSKVLINDQKKLDQDEVKGSKRKSKITKQLQKVFDEVMKDPASADFYYNVNEPRPMPRYYIIENLEIDLKSVELKLENDLYTDVEEFLQDFRNIAKTCVDYFGPIHKISKKSGKLLDLAGGLVSRRNLSLPTGSKSDLVETLNNDSNNKVGNPIGKSIKRKTEEFTETTSKKNRNDSPGFVCEECGTLFAYLKGYQRHSKSKSACANSLKKAACHPKDSNEITDHQTETRDKSRRIYSTKLGVATLFDSEGLNQTSKDIKKKMKFASEDCQQISTKNALDNHVEEERHKCGELFGLEKSNGGDNEIVSSHDARSFSQIPPSPSAASSLKPLSRRKSLPKKNCGFTPLFPRGVPVSHPQDNIVIDADDDNFEPPGLLVRSLVDAIANTNLPLN